MLSLRDVHVHIGKLHILQGVNLEVKEGECAALLGRNGVGKTTTLRSIMGLVATSAGRSSSTVPISRNCRRIIIPRKGIGYVPQGRGIFPTLSVMENLNIGAARKARHRARRLCVRLLSPPQGAAKAIGRHIVGRRATNARDCALPDDAAKADHS